MTDGQVNLGDDHARYILRPCCGMLRSVPKGVQIGETFSLVPCPRCASTFTGTLVAGAHPGTFGVEEADRAAA